MPTEEQRAHAATVEINRGMKGEYSIRVVARADDPNLAVLQALDQLELMEIAIGLHSPWHAGISEFHPSVLQRLEQTARAAAERSHE